MVFDAEAGKALPYPFSLQAPKNVMLVKAHNCRLKCLEAFSGFHLKKIQMKHYIKKGEGIHVLSSCTGDDRSITRMLNESNTEYQTSNDRKKTHWVLSLEASPKKPQHNNSRNAGQTIDLTLTVSLGCRRKLTVQELRSCNFSIITQHRQ